MNPNPFVHAAFYVAGMLLIGLALHMFIFVVIGYVPEDLREMIEECEASRTHVLIKNQDAYFCIPGKRM